MSDPITPNMNLIQPIPGVDSGISAANSYNSNFSVIDQHNHSVGSGAQITPDGLNINASLPFNSNPATGLAYANITTQGGSVPAPINYSVYFSGLEFFVKDGAGNAVQITTGGTVNATSSGISSGTATASFVASALVVNADTNKPANVQCASVLLGNNVTSSNYLTLAPPSAMAANFSLTLPSIPAQTNVMTLDTSGNISSITYNAVGQAMTATGANAVAASRTRATGSTVGVGGVAVSSSCGTFSTNSTSGVAVTNLSVTITTSGRPVQVQIVSDGSVTNLNADFSPSGSALAVARIFRDTTKISNYATLASIPSTAIQQLDFVAAGTYTYTVKLSTSNGADPAFIDYSVLVAYEI